jgi:DNA-binding transcriptional LysR family regulator
MHSVYYSEGALALVSVHAGQHSTESFGRLVEAVERLASDSTRRGRPACWLDMVNAGAELPNGARREQMIATNAKFERLHVSVVSPSLVHRASVASLHWQAPPRGGRECATFGTAEEAIAWHEEIAGASLHALRRLVSQAWADELRAKLVSRGVGAPGAAAVPPRAERERAPHEAPHPIGPWLALESAAGRRLSRNHAARSPAVAGAGGFRATPAGAIMPAAMEMHQVRYFLAVVELRSFTRAAERCHVSQPTLTAAIKKLEDELGGPLLLRERGGAKLTELGRLVLPRCQSIEAEAKRVALLAENHQHLRQVPFRLGVLETLGPARLAPYLASFRSAAPGVELEMQIAGAEAVLRQLEDAEVDVVLTNLVDEAPGYCVVVPLYRERYVVLLPPGHRLAESAAVRLADLADEPYIDRLACEMREKVARLCAAREAPFYATYRAAREEWVQSLVAAGVGFALMPEHSVLLGEAVKRPLIEPALERTVVMARSADRPLAPAAQAFWRAMVERADLPLADGRRPRGRP